MLCTYYTRTIPDRENFTNSLSVTDNVEYATKFLLLPRQQHPYYTSFLGMNGDYKQLIQGLASETAQDFQIMFFFLENVSIKKREIFCTLYSSVYMTYC